MKKLLNKTYEELKLSVKVSDNNGRVSIMGAESIRVKKEDQGSAAVFVTLPRSFIKKRKSKIELEFYNGTELIQKAKTKEELKQLWKIMKEKAFLSYKVDVKAIDENAKDFEELSIENQRRFLLECIKKNHLYVNYSEIDDEEYGVDEEDKKINREFYGN